jgi:hypothetical protein
MREVCLHRLVQGDPLGGQIGHRIGLRLAADRVEHRPVDVGPRVLGQHGPRAAGDVLGDQGGGVAAPGVDPVERLAVGGEPQRMGGRVVIQIDTLNRLGRGNAGLDRIVVHAAFRPGPGAAAQLEVLVDQERAETLVLEHQGELAAGQVERMHVVPGSRLFGPQEPVRNRADLQHLGLGLVEGRQGARRAAGGRDPIKLEVLVAALVVDIEHRGVVRGPEVGADRAHGFGRDRAGGGRISGRRDPNVQHPVERGQPGEPAAVRADPTHRPGRIAKELLAFDQWRGVHRRLHGSSGSARRPHIPWGWGPPSFHRRG